VLASLKWSSQRISARLIEIGAAEDEAEGKELPPEHRCGGEGKPGRSKERHAELGTIGTPGRVEPLLDPEAGLSVGACNRFVHLIKGEISWPT